MRLHGSTSACCTSKTGSMRKPFCVAVIAAKRQHFADDTAARLPLDMDDEIDSFCDLRFGVGRRSSGHDSA